MITGPQDLTEIATVDSQKKRIYLVFEGFLSKDQAEDLQERYRRAIAEAGSGFTVLSFFKDFVPGTAEIQDVFRSMIAMASKGGCRKAARTGSGSVMGPLQMGRLAKESSYPSHHFDTWEEAEAYLDADDG